MDNNFNNNMSTVQMGDVQSNMTGMPNMTVPAPEVPNSQTGMPNPQMGMPNPQMGMPNPQMGMPNPQMGMPNPQTGMPNPQMGMSNPQMGMPNPQMGMPNPQMGMPNPQMGMPNPQMQYTQQPQMGYQQQLGQPPMQQVEPAKKQKAPKVKKPLTGGKIAAIIGGSVAGIAAIVCGIIFIPKLFKPAKDVVIDAFENTFTIASEDYTFLSQNADLATINDTFNSTGGSVDMTFSIDEVYGEEFSGDISLDITGDYDPANMLVNCNFALNYDGNSLMSVNMIGDETTTYLQLEDAIDAYFTLPNEAPFVALENSPLGEAMGLYGAPDTNFYYFGQSEDATGLNSAYVEAADALWDSITVEKEGKAKITVNGEDIKAKEYIVTVTEDDIIDFFDKILDAVVNDPAFVESAASNGMTVEDAEMAVQSVSSMLPTLIGEDLVLKVYVKDDKVVKLTSEASTSVYGATIGYDFYLDISDDAVSGEFVMDVAGEELTITLDVEDADTAPTGKIVMSAAGEDIVINFSMQDDSDENASNTKFYFDVVYEGEEMMAFDMSLDMDNKSGDFDALISATVYGEEYMNVTVQGCYENVTEGVGYTVVFDAIDVSVYDESIVTMSAKYTVDTSSVSVDDVDSSLPVYDLTVIDEEEFSQIILDNEEALTEWMNNISGNVGDLDGLFYDDYYEDDYYEDDYYEDDYYEDEYTAEDMTLGYGDVKVRILGTIAGFDLDSACSSWVDYTTPEYSWMSYYFYEDCTVDQAIEWAYLPTEDQGYTIYETVENQQMVLADGSTVYYSYVVCESYGLNMTAYSFVKEIGDNILTTEAFIYTDDDFFTLEELAETLNSQYYEVIQ